MFNLSEYAVRRVFEVSVAARPLEHMEVLRDRFSDWWNGEKPGTAARTRPAKSSDRFGESTFDGNYGSPFNPDRMAAIEAVWGNGFRIPGGERFARSLAALLSPSSKKFVLDLTADLGGTARAIADQYDMYVDALEPIADLAAEGQKRSTAAGLGKRVSISAINVDTFELKPQRYHSIYTRERLFSVAAKERVLDQCVCGLRNSGQLLITDFMLPDSTENPIEVSALMRPGEAPHLWTMSQYIEALKQREFDVKIARDLSVGYAKTTVSDWLRVVDRLRRGSVDRRHADLILDEGELWAARWRAMNEHKIVLGQIHAQLGKVH